MARTKKSLEEPAGDAENVRPDSEVTAKDTVIKDMSKPVKVYNSNLKGKKLYLPDGSIGEFDGEGILEMSALNAQQLLTIPGFTLIT
jgi:hypothetical protein